MSLNQDSNNPKANTERGLITTSNGNQEKMFAKIEDKQQDHIIPVDNTNQNKNSSKVQQAPSSSNGLVEKEHDKGDQKDEPEKENNMRGSAASFQMSGSVRDSLKSFSLSIIPKSYAEFNLSRKEILEHLIAPTVVGVTIFHLLLFIYSQFDFFYGNIESFNLNKDMTYRAYVFMFEQTFCVGGMVYQCNFVYFFLYNHKGYKQAAIAMFNNLIYWVFYAIPFVFDQIDLYPAWNYSVIMMYICNGYVTLFYMITEKKVRLPLTIFALYCCVQGLEFFMWSAFAVLKTNQYLFVAFLLVLQIFFEKVVQFLRVMTKNYKLGGKSLLLVWGSLMQMKLLMLNSIFSLTDEVATFSFWFQLLALFLNQIYFTTGFHLIWHMLVFLFFYIDQFLNISAAKDKVFNIFMKIYRMLNKFKTTEKVERLIRWILPKPVVILTDEQKEQMTINQAKVLKWTQVLSLIYTFLRIPIFLIQRIYLYQWNFIADYDGQYNNELVSYFMLLFVGTITVIYCNFKYKLQLFLVSYADWSMILKVPIVIRYMLWVDVFLLTNIEQ